jgi:mono/diheme cytochrome c family protein
VSNRCARGARSDTRDARGDVDEFSFRRVRKNSRRRGFFREKKSQRIRVASAVRARVLRDTILAGGSMRQLFRWTIGLAFVAAAASASAQTKDQIARGMKVYGEQKCSMCHSIAGKGNAKGSLDDVGARLSSGDIREWLVDPESMRKKANAERKPLMKSFATLAKDDLDGLVAYLQTLKSK